MTYIEDLEWRIQETEKVLKLTQQRLEEEPDRASIQLQYTSLKIRYDRFIEERAEYEKQQERQKKIG